MLFFFKKCIDWFKERTANERLLMMLLILSVFMVMLRWEPISKNLKETAKRYGLIKEVETNTLQKPLTK